MTARLTHLSLFSGIGGLDIAAEWAGFKTVGQCEWADYPTKILEKHWPDVPRWRDIRTLTKEDFHGRTGMGTVDLVSGGFPCQPFSLAGKRKGRDDDRYLWPEMLRVIEELRPRWVIGENVAGIVNMALDTVLSDLESIGYSCQTFIIPACAIDAPHRRDRCAIVGCYANSFNKLPVGKIREGEDANAGGVCENVPDPNSFNGGTQRTERKGQSWETGVAYGGDYVCNPAGQRLPDGASEALGEPGTEPKLERSGCGNDVPNPDNGGRAMRRERELSAVESPGSGGGDNRGRTPEHGTGERRAVKPGLGGMADGLPHWLDEPLNVPRIARGIKNRVDRLKCLGNAVVPQQFYPIFQAIAEIEKNGCHD